MAKWSYDITGAEIIMRDVPVYDAATIAQGEFIMLGTTDPDSGNDEGISFVTGYNATAANQMIDGLGISLETVTTASSPSVASGYSTTTGPCYAKAIINPFAIYMVEQSLAAADDVAITSTSTTTLTVPSLQDDIDGCHVYFPLTQTGVKGSLRLITAAASGSCTMDSALVTTGGASDTIVLISAPNKYSLPLEATALKVSSGDCQATYNAATNIRILETLIDRDAGLEIITPAKFNGLNNLNLVKGGNGPRIFYKVMLKDHIFGVQE
jgi:hypothetical protein